MTNFDAIKQMPAKDFANMIFHVVKYDCKTEADFEAFLVKEVQPELEDKMKEALQEMQCSSSN